MKVKAKAVSNCLKIPSLTLLQLAAASNLGVTR